MRTVVIGGASRSGKSTLANAIYQATKCRVIHIDHICGCLRKAHPDRFPEVDGFDAQCNEYREIIVRFIMKAGNEFDYVSVFESSYVDPETVARRLGEDEYVSLFLGYPRVDPEVKLRDMRTYGAQHPRCWTNSFPDDFLREQIGFCTELSVKHESDCSRLGLPFFDVSEAFVDAHNEARDYVLRKLEVGDGPGVRSSPPGDGEKGPG